MKALSDTSRRWRGNLALAALLLMVVGLFTAPAARAQDAVSAAAESLAQDPVYVEPSMRSYVSRADADALRRRIAQSSSGPIFIAVLRDAAVGPEDQLPNVFGRLNRGAGQSGVYAVATESRLRADSDVLRRRAAVEQARTEPIRRVDAQGLSAPLVIDFVDSLEAVESRGGLTPVPGGDGRTGYEGGSGNGAGLPGLVLLALLVVGLGFMLMTRRRHHRVRDDSFVEAKENARDDLVALGEDIRALDLDIEMPNVAPEARHDYGVAVSAYQRAEEAWELAKSPEDLQPVSMALEEGRWAMGSAKARLAGQAPPQRRPPCFFDPRHGPSTREVEWSPPYGQPRSVPACEADALRVEEGEAPQTREVMHQGQMVPYYNAGPAYAPFAGGFFGGVGGGMLPGLLMGSLLGYSMTGMAFPGSADASMFDGYGDSGGGGFGGDFGGGDSGGGGFGGDFGGGDSGGGGGGE